MFLLFRKPWTAWTNRSCWCRRHCRCTRSFWSSGRSRYMLIFYPNYYNGFLKQINFILKTRSYYVVAGPPGKPGFVYTNVNIFNYFQFRFNTKNRRYLKVNDPNRILAWLIYFFFCFFQSLFSIALIPVQFKGQNVLWYEQFNDF